ncbi:translation initiation factor IF-3 [Candidatus Phytoplasma pini]|uniref:Translation initiation factor IF-3 n=1 Tax=Candidatus Phytoplasma pini TaxID=267362 RepID=A0A559KJX1_9MOLU|nr:translation initiation factor IF-3 [Candidatus Phytoplasma pini]TVY12407.1 Translation initiation factor IF-3 [Candidatus Phytoplasma pini]
MSIKYKKNKNKDNFKENKVMDILYNEKIPQGEYLLIDENGEKLGIFDKSLIMNISSEKETDALLISANSSPKVVRLMNYSKFRYQHQKKLKQIKKKQNQIVIKKISMSPNIQDNDLFNTQIPKARNFLIKNNKVKIIIIFRGRMIQHTDLGTYILNKIISNVQDIAIIDTSLKMEGNQMIAFLSPKIKKNN